PVRCAAPCHTPSFPTRRSSDLGHAVKAAGGSEALYIFQEWAGRWDEGVNDPAIVEGDWERMQPPFRIGWEWLRRKVGDDAQDELDRKSTRLNSSHVKSSYAVFC